MFIQIIISLSIISQITSLKCYSCKGGQECGLNFSPKSTNVKIVQSSLTDNTIYSCSIRVTPEGLTTREMIPSYSCRSSSYEYCCNEDLCNTLLSPPLPALTSLKCTIGTCSMSDGICVTDADYLTVLSSATESCSINYGSLIKRSYKKGCQPTINDPSRSRMQSLKKSPVYCCHSPECNKEILTTGRPDPILQCYTCDSRITGQDGCAILNQSNPNVYKSGSSSHNEACATIVGLPGKDSITKKSYPGFTIRTFVYKCVSKSSGTVSYGGATFRGRIDCCSTNFCNIKNASEVKHRFKLSRLAKLGLIIGLIVFISLLIGIILGFIVRSQKEKKSKDRNIKYDQCSTKDVEYRLNQLSNEQNRISFPDPTDAP